jgi:phosphatidylserine decarboxylase
VFAPRASVFLLPSAGALLAAAALAFVLASPGRGEAAAAAVVFAGLFAFFAVFFRDPNRTVGEGVVSAADGRVRAVETVGDRLRISVFMNVTNVHVNRFPLDARVDSVDDAGAGFRPAYAPAAEANVQRRYRLSTEVGPVEVVQITGIVARRLVSFVAAGDRHAKGARLGMIVLGSRVDVYLPSDRVRPVVEPGAVVHAGTTTIARPVS